MTGNRVAGWWDVSPGAWWLKIRALAPVLGDKMMAKVYPSAAVAVAAADLLRQSLFGMTAADTAGEQPGVEEAQRAALTAWHLRAALDQPQ